LVFYRVSVDGEWLCLKVTVFVPLGDLRQKKLFWDWLEWKNAVPGLVEDFQQQRQPESIYYGMQGENSSFFILSQKSYSICSVFISGGTKNVNLKKDRTKKN
jgi:hypothetical protein